MVFTIIMVLAVSGAGAYVLKLRGDCKRLDKERFNVENMQGLTGYWKQFLFNREVRQLEC